VLSCYPAHTSLCSSAPEEVGDPDVKKRRGEE